LIYLTIDFGQAVLYVCGGWNLKVANVSNAGLKVLWDWICALQNNLSLAAHFAACKSVKFKMPKKNAQPDCMGITLLQTP
jgi:hypothetical protein